MKKSIKDDKKKQMFSDVSYFKIEVLNCNLADRTKLIKGSKRLPAYIISLYIGVTNTLL